MDLGLRGKTAIVAAASQGLGKAVACAFAAEGANVVMFSRREDAIQAAAHEVTSMAAEGAQVTPLTADVTKPEDLERVVEKSGGADILFANAGGPRPGYFDDLSDQDFYAALDLNLMSAVRLARLVLPHMRQRKWGRIIISTSYSVKQPIENLLLSNTVRSGVTAWAKTLADQVAVDNITVNTLAPGRIDTERIRQIDEDAARRSGRPVEEIAKQTREAIPLKRYGRPDEFGAAAAFLASEKASYINGVTLLIDGGLFRGTY